jgi:hypothetical protein
LRSKKPMALMPEDQLGFEVFLWPQITHFLCVKRHCLISISDEMAIPFEEINDLLKLA